MFLLKRNGIYHLEYFDEAENRTRRISTKQKIKRDAIKFLSDFENNLKSKKTFKHILLEDFDKKYSEYIKINLSKKYYLTVKLSFKQLIAFTGNIPISKITFPQLDNFFTETYSRTKQGAWTYYRVLKSAFNKAVLWDYIQQNPFDKIKLPKLTMNNPLFIDEPQFLKILDKEPDQVLRDFYTLAFNTGMRLGEIVNLRWKEVFLSDSLIKVLNTKEFTLKGKRERAIPINNTLLLVLKRNLPKVFTLITSDYVFNKRGKKFNSDYVSKQFKAAVRLVKTVNQDFHFHDLRHSFATNLISKGASIYAVKELLGHKDVKTTQMYSHSTVDWLKETFKKISEVNKKEVQFFSLN